MNRQARSPLASNDVDDSVWIIDDDASIRWVLDKALRSAGFAVTTFETADEAFEQLRHNALPPSALITDIRMPGSSGLQLLEHMQQHHPRTPVLVMTAYSDLDSTVAAFEGGAFEYIPKPFDVDEVIERTQRACRDGGAAAASSAAIDVPQRPVAIAAPSSHETALEDAVLIGDAPAMQSLFKAIGRLARSRATVLVNGESGSGKELIARALHRHSSRAARPFVALNMAAIPHELMESELFGHEKGAFTGASSTRVGRFEQANGGTLFLDEIGDMPEPLQTRLLRVLADGQFYRVGGHTPLAVDVRIVAATHQDLARLVEQRRFREDLYHRLNVIRIVAPPLRERREDIPRLMAHFLAQAADELGEAPKHMSDEFELAITALPWPGNVRQLQNTAHWLTVMASGNELSVQDLPEELRGIPRVEGTAWENAFRSWVQQKFAMGEDSLVNQALPAMERILIRCALQQSLDHRQEAARLLGWGRNTLTRKIRELGID